MRLVFGLNDHMSIREVCVVFVHMSLRRNVIRFENAGMRIEDEFTFLELKPFLF